MLEYRNLKLAALCIVCLFVLTTMLLHASLETIDDGNDLLSKTNDWSRIKEAGKKAAAKVKKRVLPSSSDKHNKKQKFLRNNNNNKILTRREQFEQEHPPEDLERIRSVVQDLRKPMASTQPNMPYDIFNCPAEPPKDYPFTWSLVDNILKDWNPDITDMPSKIYQGLCVFDWNKDREKAETYRRQELPMIVQNNPDIMRTSERWNSSPDYLLNLVGRTPQRNEHSKTNHFMFWRVDKRKKKKKVRHIPQGWQPPTENIELPLDQWMKRAQELQASTQDQTTQEHWYFRLNGAYQGKNDYLYDELPIFVPEPGNPSFFMVEPEEERGINCRFGMKGVIAEAHFDPTRNWIVLLGGQRRYILAHPDQCINMELHPIDHPSGRHSKIDWSHPPNDPERPFSKAQANEVVLQAGDALYLPTSWFHFIVSLNINYQCNARSGVTTENHRYLYECGFPVSGGLDKKAIPKQ